ncbi:MAG: GDP-L-fucose synthase [Alphaproteobacteria bacterium]|jgi:GDP-L-fucose synthase|nr:GDP-L-fucose synthase [Alphaproteobacteria bacterium]MDP6517398.1 GDP-L-fucose synthase [Alphaproteobacteria bacterium]
MNAERADPRFELEGRRVWVAGHRGMVGGALLARLADERCEILTVDRGDLDLRRQAAVEDWIGAARPHAVFVAAATVGGILANDSRPAEFLYDNLVIETNIIEAARRVGVAKLVLLGSTCIYPRLAAQPMREESLLTGPLEPTNQWYAVAKIAGIKLCDAYRRQYGCDFVSAQPTNVYGPNDNFDLASAHVLAALLRRIHEARLSGAAEVPIWGTGRPRREFLHVADLADALVYLMHNYSAEGPINIGTGHEISIGDLARLIAETVGYEGEFHYQTDKPDGTPRKLSDVSRMRALGWTARIGLDDGLRQTYRWFLDHQAADGDP